MPTQLEAPPTTITPRAAVIAMPEYHPPLAGRDALRLDFNENTFAPSPRVFAKLQSLTAEGLTIYPERQQLEQITAAHYGLEPNEVMLTNGVDEAIHLLACTFLDPTDEVLLCTPSFFMYDVSCSMMTNHLVRIQADDTFAFPLARFLAAITPRTKLIMIATPNNPTGQTVSREQILQICAAAPHAVVFADEADLQWYVAQIRTGRERVYAALRELNIRTWPSAANFILMDIGPRHKELVATMREHGVLLRDRSADPGCEGYVRITIGVEDHVTRGLAALRASLAELNWTPAEGRQPA